MKKSWTQQAMEYLSKGSGGASPVKVPGSVNNLNPDPIPILFWIMNGIWFSPFLIFLGFGLDWELSKIFAINDLSITEQLKIFIPLFLLLITFKPIPFNKIGSLKCFGFPVCNIGPGPKILAKILLTLKLFPRDSQQEQFPGDTDKIFKGADDLPLPDGMVRPLRITTGKPKKAKGEQDPLAIQMALEFIYFLRIQIDNPLLFELNYGDLDEFWRQVRDTGDKLLNKKVVIIPGVSALLANTADLMDQLEASLCELCSKGGVKVIESGISAPDLTHKLAEALRDIGVIRAQVSTEENKILRLGSANAKAAGMLIKETSDQLKEADPSAKAAYVGEKVLSDKTTFLGVEGISQAFGLADALTKGIKRGAVE